MKLFTVLGLLCSFFFGSLRWGFVPTVVFDAAAPGAAVSSRASGYLYGLAEEGVPDPLMAQSVDIASVSQKVIDGLQHPIGDVDHVAGNLNACDYIVVYLQDAYATWYYENDAIFEARRAGTYDWQRFLTGDYFPKVREKVTALQAKPYADRLVYCLFNECDNGVWFGTWQEKDQYAAFDDAGRKNFFSAWKQTYEFVRSLAPGAKIGGPGYYEYSAEKEAWFLNYCAENDCVPDVMIWHELGELSSEQLDLHVRSYRNLEQLTAAPVGPLPIIVTEYGTMEECGNPAKLFRYIRQIEETGVYGDIAYWRLADNLCDVSADGVSPNACWWLYRWYADMEGNLLGKQVQDMFHADVGKALKELRPTRNKHLNAFGALTEEKDFISVLAGGADYASRFVFRHLGQTNLGRRVRVRVESVSFEGLGGKVFAPTLVADYTAYALFGSLSVKLDPMDADAVYRITLSPAAEKGEPYRNESLPVRYEFEHGTLLGAAYTYDSAYATTGEASGMVGGMEYEGDGVKLVFSVPEKGNYDLSVIYGKANDGASAADRVSALANLRLDGEPEVLYLPNTVRSEFTSKITLTRWLERGDHEIAFTHNTGTFVLDSLIVTPESRARAIALLPEKEASSEAAAGFIAVAPQNGRYRIETDAESVRVNGRPCEHAGVFLRQGLNLIELAGADSACAIYPVEETAPVDTFLPEDLALSGGAEIVNGALTGLTSAGGEAAFRFTAPQSGEYCVTLTYSNNAEGGAHAYNVDLIERYFTVACGGETLRVWCRNTYSDENIAAVTFCVTARAGENTVRLSNDGSVRFNGGETAAPLLYGVAVTPLSVSLE